jgi:hypothetical protein
MLTMPITRDYLEPTDTQDASETKFIDQVLEGWADWARQVGIDQRPTPAGELWQIQAIIEMKDYVFQLTDAGFVLVDQRIAVLPRRLRATIFIEYTTAGTSDHKARRMGLNRAAYRQRLHAAQWALFASLLPDIDNWRQKPL